MSFWEKRWTFIGPMGSGKSSLSRRLSLRYGGAVFDTDKEFERRYGEISAFFASKGEEEFRRIETELLLEAANSDAAYISTGGGAVLSKRGMCALRKVSDIVYLTAPTDVLASRIKKSDRPLKNKLIETVRARTPLYEKYADFTVSSEVNSEKAFGAALAEPRKSRYKILLCDSDNTLLDFDEAMRQSLIAVVRVACDTDRTDDEIVAAYSRINDTVWAKLERGEITRSELLDARFAMLKTALNADFVPKDTNELYISEMRKTRCVIDGALDMLRTVRVRGIKVYIITNSFTCMARERLKALDGYNDGAFVSEEIGFDKPDIRFFEHVYEKLGKPDKKGILVFGDGENSDIAGGAAFGVDTCLFDPSGRHIDTAADYSVGSYTELLNLL